MAGAVHQVADRNRILPHYGMEREVMRLGFDWAILRPVDFMQNLETGHRDYIRSRGRIALFSVQRFGGAAGITDDVPRLLGCLAGDLRS